MMPELLKCLQTCPRPVGVFAGRVLVDDELIGLRRIHEQVLPLKALAAQQGDLRLHIAPRPAGALGARQVEQGLFAVALVVIAIGIVEVMVECHTAAPGQTGQGEKHDQGTHGDVLHCAVYRLLWRFLQRPMPGSGFSTVFKVVQRNNDYSDLP